MKTALIRSRGGRFLIWDEPKHRAKYVLGVDISEGKVRDRKRSSRAQLYSYSDERPDYSAVMVVEIETGQHVASWHGYVQPTDFYPIVAAIGYHYNTALIVPEINAMGVTVVEGLVKILDYPNVYRSKIWNRVEADPLGSEWGWRTTTNSRPYLIARLDEAIQQGRLFTRDAQLVDELRTMQYDEMGVPRASGKDKDDRVMALGLALQGRYESLNGTAGSVDPAPWGSNPLADQRWNLVQKELESRNHGHRPPGARGRPRPIPRSRRISAW